MPRDSQGNFTNVRNWPQDEANGINIEADLHQEGDDDQAQGITDSLDRKGRGGMQADLAMGNFKVTQVQEGTTATDASNIGQIQNGAFSYAATDTGTADAYVVSLTPSVTSYTAGLTLSFIAANANTGASTLQVNGVVPGIAIEWEGKPLVEGSILAGDMVTVRFDGTAFQMISSPQVLPVEYGGTGGTTALGTAAFEDVGIAIGDVVQLEDVGGNAGLPAVDGSQLTNIIILGTPTIATGTSITFTGIPAGTARIKILWTGISAATGDNWIVRIGSGTIENAGYSSVAELTGDTIANSTEGFIVTGAASASGFYSGIVELCLLDGTNNIWVSSSILAKTNSPYSLSKAAGTKTITGALDRVEIRNLASSAFDAGTFNIQYE